MAFALVVYLFLLTGLPIQAAESDSPAASPPSANSTLMQLEQRLQTLTQRMSEPLRNVTRDQIDQAQLDADSAALQHQTTRTDLAATEKRIKELGQAIHTLETQEQALRTTPLLDEVRHAQQLEQLQTDLNKYRNELSQEKQRLQELQEQLKQTARYRALIREWLTQIEEQYRIEQEQQRRQTHAHYQQRLQEQIDAYRTQATHIQQQLSAEDRQILSTARRQFLETQWRILEVRIRLLEEERRWSDIEDTLARFAQVATQPRLAPNRIEQELKHVKALQSQLGESQTLSHSIQQLFEQQRAVIAGRQDFTGIDSRLSAQETQLITALLDELTQRQQRLADWLAQLNHLQRLLTALYRERLPRHLLERTPFSWTERQLQAIQSDLTSAAWMITHQVRLSLQALYAAIQDATRWQWLWIGASQLVFLGLLGGLRRIGWRVHRVFEAQPDKGVMLRLIAQWLWHSQGTFGIATLLLIALFFLPITRPSQGILISLVLFVLILIAALHLTGYLQALCTPPKRSWWLYGTVVIWLSLSALLLAMTLMIHLNMLDSRLETSVSRLSALYCLLISVPLWRVRGFLLRVGRPLYQECGWFRGLSLWSAVLLIYLVAIGTVGLVGYLNLTALVNWYGGWFFGVVGWALFLQGLLDEAAELLRQPLSRLPNYDPAWLNEWLWPTHRIASLVVIGVSVQLLLYAASWHLPDPDQFAATVSIVIIGSLIGHEIVYAIARFVARQQRSVLGRALIKFTHAPMQFIMPLTALQWTLSYLPLSSETAALWSHALLIGQIGAISWGLISLVSVLNAVVINSYRSDVKNNFAARRVHTQIQVLKQIVTLAVYIIATAAILMTFPTARQLGAGLLASAGVAGLVIGMAARPLLANLIAGIQIGLTQPIRLDDVVIVEGEYGRVEEINSTHVVVCIWDLRRLVLPLNYFNEKPFQNWTRSSSELIGTVFIHADYSLPIDAVRTELQRLLAETPLWDKQTWSVQVTQATDHTVEIRATMSAADASTLWNLRCHIREQLIAFIQQNYPYCLPKRRALLESPEPLHGLSHC